LSVNVTLRNVRANDQERLIIFEPGRSNVHASKTKFDPLKKLFLGGNNLNEVDLSLIIIPNFKSNRMFTVGIRFNISTVLATNTLIKQYCPNWANTFLSLTKTFGKKVLAICFSRIYINQIMEIVYKDSFLSFPFV
jgi:hypothetical protein